ncbi:MAG: carbon monoxide dehydrogenase subunit G [Gemmatimonadales bacterium]
MHLDFSGAPMIAAPRPMVFQRLIDPETVSAAAPGVESVETVGDHHFRISSGFGVGAIKLQFILDVELSDIVAPERAKMRAHGKAPGSMVDVQTSIQLEEKGPDETQLHWQARATISGTLASLGGRLLEGAARKLTEEFWDTFARQASEATG